MRPRQPVHIQTTIPERSLLSTVVLIALHDACEAPPRSIRRAVDTPRISSEAFTAMRFLFDESVSGLREYSMWLDFEATPFREKLLTLMSNNGPMKLNGFEPMQRRNFRYNYGMWFRAKNMEFTEHTLDGEDDE